jgi:hypothetical protein
MAVARCRDHIKKNILPHFQADQNVLAAIESLNHLVEENTGSSMPASGKFGRVWNNDDQLQHLKVSNCRFVTKSFNEYKALSSADVAKLQPIILPTMAAAVQGAYEVIQYLKDVGAELKIPPELQWFDQEVYLRDCTTRLPAL